MSKLVRDKIPEIINKDPNNLADYHIVKNKKTLLKLLKKKLIEEAKEVRDAQSSGDMILELVDVYEVLITLARYYEVPLNHIQFLAKSKREEKGGFTKNIVLDYVWNFPNDD